MTDAPTALRTIDVQPAPGAHVVVDHLPARDPALPAYVFLHGLASVRAGVKSTALLRRADAAGRAYARFDFRGHGASHGVLGQVTISEYVQDVEAVLDLTGPAVLIGSSLGGLVAAFAAAANTHRVRALALLSPALGFLPRLEHRLRGDGILETSEGRAFPIARRVLEDARALREDTLPARLPMPVFVAHGTADDVVPHELSAAFAAAIPHERKELWLVQDGDHRLAEPIETIYDRMEALIARS